MAESTNIFRRTGISIVAFDDPVGSRRLTMREMLRRLDIRVNLKEPWPAPPAGFEEADVKLLDAAKLILVPRKAFNFTLEGAASHPAKMPSKWMEAMQIPNDYRVAIYPNDSLPGSSVMMYAPLPRPRNNLTLRAVRADLYSGGEGAWKEIRGVYSDNRHCYPVLTPDRRLKCFNSRPAHPCLSSGGTGENDWIDCSCIICDG